MECTETTSVRTLRGLGVARPEFRITDGIVWSRAGRARYRSPEGDRTMSRLLYLCDWLPPDFGAVGQYGQLFARNYAKGGRQVVLCGISSRESGREIEFLDSGRLTTIRVQMPTYDKSRLVERSLWTVRANLRLLLAVRRDLRHFDEILFTGSPPFMIFFIVPLNLVLKKRLIYRITDFYPECLMAAAERPSLPLRLLYWATLRLRRRVHEFEVIGHDQAARLAEIGIPADRVTLSPYAAPLPILGNEQPLPVPPEILGHRILLYSGNFGVAHDVTTFVEGYRLHHKRGSGRMALWLNAVGSNADVVERDIRAEGLPVARSRPVPLEDLPRLLVTPDAHLITLRDSFVGFVLPSKVHGCIDSGRDILFIGSRKSDVHRLCSEASEGRLYCQVDTGSPQEVAESLEQLADAADARTNLFDSRTGLPRVRGSGSHNRS